MVPLPQSGGCPAHTIVDNRRLGYVNAAMAKPAHSTHPPAPIRLLNVATLAVFVGWLAAAAYALAYLVSH